MNDLMRDILGDSEYNIQPSSIHLSPYLTRILNSGFRIEEDYTLFKDFVYFGPGDLYDSYKKTEYEEFLNEVRIHHSQVKVGDVNKSIQEGVEFGRQLYEKLKTTYSANFRILIEADPPMPTSSDILDDWQCKIKFHKVRPDVDAEFKASWISMCNEYALLTIE